MSEPTIEDLKALQRQAGMNDRHLVYLGRDGFRIAHTDVERAAIEPLTTCPLHEWLMSLDEAPAPPGIYVAWPHEPDAYSEPYGQGPWEFYVFVVDR